ncbi:MAG: ABC transporter substrate-binding protein [Candidatus Velthaea sp.]
MQRKSFIAAGTAAVGLAGMPRFTLAAGNAATVKIGFIESFSGVFSDLGNVHRQGALLALEDANRSGRVKYEFVFADDASKPATATTEARRLISQENVDALFGGTSSAVGLALEPLTLEAGTFYLCLGPQDSAITSGKASKLTYRFGPNVRMLLKPLSRRVLALGKKWYFIQADYALGKDAYSQLSQILKSAGGTEVGVDVVPLGTTDFSAVLTKLRNSDADVLVLANSGLDAANTLKQFVDFGLNKKMKAAGISLEDIYYKALPLDQVQGVTFPVLWSPFVSPSAAKLAARMRRSIKGPVSSRHYLGYMAAASLVDRMNAAGTTRADKLAAAFDDHAFDAYKSDKAVYRGCTHQCAQDVYAGTVVSQKRFNQTQFMYDIVSEVTAAESDGNCDSPWARDAKTSLASQTIATRQNYVAKTF